MKNEPHYSYGFTLIEMMIASTALCALCLGFGMTIKHQMDSVSLMEDKISSMKLEGDVASLLSDPNACSRTFAGRDVRSNTPIRIRDSSSSITLQGGNQGTRKDNLQVQSIVSSNASITSPNSTGTIDINVSLTRDRSSFNGIDLKPLRVPIFVMVDSNYRVAHCSSDRAVIATRTIATTPSFRNCTHRSSTFNHGTSIHGYRIYQESCEDTYFCLDGIIVPAPLDCRSGRNNGD